MLLVHIFYLVLQEEVEALDDEETVAAGTYRRASEEELAKRKIYKVSR